MREGLRHRTSNGYPMTDRRTMRRVWMLLGTGLLMGACSPADSVVSGSPDAVESPSRAERQDGRATPRARDSRAPAEIAEGQAIPIASASPGTARSQGAGSGAPVARSRVVVDDPDGDAEASGEAPDHAEIVLAEVTGMGSRVRFTMSLGGDVPDRLSSEDFLDVGFGVHRGGRSYSIYAQGDDEGWRAYLATRGRSESLAQGFKIAGSSVSFELARTDLGGRRPFTWDAHSSWTHSTLTSTDFSFDSAPNEGRARFPRRARN